MGYFAVLAEAGGSRPRVGICHLNLWSLEALLGRRRYLFDVGLRLQAPDVPVSAVRLALPFGTATTSLVDLHDQVLSQRTAHLIFGHRVTIQGQTVDWSVTGQPPDPVRVLSLDSGRAALDVSRSGRDWSIWTVGFGPVLQPGAQGYLRVRFVLGSVRRTWLQRRGGVLVDFRMSDVREALPVPHWTALEEDILPIERLNAFVVAPSTLVQAGVSPTLHYMRLLEGESWEPYLRRRTSFFGEERLVIYQWRNGERAVIPDNPFRMFLWLVREPWSPRWRDGLLFFVFALFMGLVVVLLDRNYTTFEALLAGVLAAGFSWLIAMLGLATLPGIRDALASVGVIRNVVGAAIAVLVNVEDRLYAWRARH